MSLINMEIKGMHCNSCKALIEDVLEDLGASVKSFTVDVDSQIGTLSVESELTAQQIVEEIKEEGEYEVTVL